MDLHPGTEKRRVAETIPAKSDSMRRALQENEDWYQDLVEHSHDLLCIHDLEGRLLSVNPAPARVLGYSVEELLRIPMVEILTPEYRPHFAAYLREIERDGESHGVMAVLTRSGEQRIWEYHNTLRTGGVESPIVLGIAHDVTEQRRTEKRLREVSESLLDKVRESERAIRELKLFRTLVDQSNDSIKVIDPETLRILDVNEKACSELGYSREEMLSLGVFDIDPVVTESSVAKIREELRESGSVIMETVHRRKDGSTFPVEVSMRRVQLDGDYVVAISRDITERKRTEARLRASESRYRALHEHSPVGICLVETLTGRFLGANPKYCEITGRTEEDLLGRDFQSITHPDDLVQNCEMLRQLTDGKVRHYEMEKRYVRPDGSVRWVEAEVVTIAPEGEGPIWHMAIVQDITERRKTEEALKKSEEKFSKAFRQSPMALTLSSIKNHQYIDVNNTFERLTGWRRDEVIGRTALDLGLWIRDDGVHLAKQLLAEGSVHNVEARYRMRDGSIRIGLSTAELIELNGEQCMLAVTADITERKQAEEALRTSERCQNKIAKQLEAERARLIEAQAVAKVGSWEAELPSLEATWSEQTHRIFETDACHFHPIRSDFVEFVHPEDRAKVDAAFQSSLDKGGPSSVEYRIVMADGRVKVLDEQWRVFHDERGQPIRLVGTCRDITDKKGAEEALRRSEENYRNFVSQSSEGIYQENLEPAIPIDLAEDEFIHRFLRSAVMAECNNAMAAMYGFASGEELRGRPMSERVLPEDAGNIEMAREFMRSGFRFLEHESREVDRYGNPKIFTNSMVGTVEDGRLIHVRGIQRDITEKVKLEESRQRAEEAQRQNLAQLQKVTEELRLAKEKLSEEKLYLEESIDTELGFGEIVGRSSALKEVMQKVAKVAPSDATVLLLGETGTGKELVARAIHGMSRREGNSFIKLNCAAIPSGLLESELFGHEKGAFTGAVARKLGRLELADRGTLFLDEVGEIPLGLQPKLLRVLQDLEFERLGGTQTLKVNFRLLAATNRDLLQSVKGREFRSDLYYRLNVFPILIPPLRERREDIRPLIEHFVLKFAAQMKKSITSIPSKTMEMMVRWDWPGNIRELENFVERSVILTPGSVLQAPLAELHTVVEQGNAGASGSLRDKERERILRALRDCHGKLGGPDGAAARLGLKRTTLQSKLDQLGIKPGSYRG
jgi:PAS domain S-box-containing protein